MTRMSREGKLHLMQKEIYVSKWTLRLTESFQARTHAQNMDVAATAATCAVLDLIKADMVNAVLPKDTPRPAGELRVDILAMFRDAKTEMLALVSHADQKMLIGRDAEGLVDDLRGIKRYLADKSVFEAGYEATPNDILSMTMHVMHAMCDNQGSMRYRDVPMIGRDKNNSGMFIRT